MSVGRKFRALLLCLMHTVEWSFVRHLSTTLKRGGLRIVRGTLGGQTQTTATLPALSDHLGHASQAMARGQKVQADDTCIGLVQQAH